MMTILSLQYGFIILIHVLVALKVEQLCRRLLNLP